jgi:hypothetical protein
MFLPTVRDGLVLGAQNPMVFTSLLSLVLSLQIHVVASLYQYTDNQGNQHVVSDSELVPPRYRRNVQVLDDEGQVLGELREQNQVRARDEDDLERLKARGRGREKVGKKSSRQRLEELLEEDEDEKDPMMGGQEKKKERRSAASSETTPYEPPTGSPAWMLLGVGLVFIIFALKILRGFLKVLAFACGVMALLMFVSEEFGETAVGSKVKYATEKLVKPLKKVQAIAGDKAAGPLKAPYEIIQKVRGAVQGHANSAEERNAILDKLSEAD